MTQNRIVKQYTASDIEITKGRCVSMISCETVDAEGEVIMASGVNYKQFMMNPLVYFNHSYLDPENGIKGAVPIGRCLALKHLPNIGLRAVTEFAERPEKHVGEWFPYTVQSLIEQDIIKGFSIGVWAYDSDIQKPKAHEIERFGETCRRIIRRSHMYEYSVAPLPCNPDTLIEAVGKGRITRSMVKSVFGMSLPERRLFPVTKKLIKKEINIDKMVDEAFKMELAKRQGKIYF